MMRFDEFLKIFKCFIKSSLVTLMGLLKADFHQGPGLIEGEGERLEVRWTDWFDLWLNVGWWECNQDDGSSDVDWDECIQSIVSVSFVIHCDTSQSEIVLMSRLA